VAIATIWLLAKDHNREWKRWQLTDRKKEAWMTRAQHDALAFQYAGKMDSFAADIRLAQTQAVSPQLTDQFKLLAAQDAERLEKAVDFADLDSVVAELDEAAAMANETQQALEQAGETEDPSLTAATRQAAKAAMDARGDVFGELQKFVTDAVRLEKGVVATKKSVAADRTAAVSELGLRVGEGASAEIRAEVQSRVDGYSESITGLTEEIVLAQAYRMDLESIVKQAGAEQAELEKQQGVMTTDLQKYIQRRRVGHPLAGP